MVSRSQAASGRKLTSQLSFTYEGPVDSCRLLPGSCLIPEIRGLVPRTRALNRRSQGESREVAEAYIGHDMIDDSTVGESGEDRRVSVCDPEVKREITPADEPVPTGVLPLRRIRDGLRIVIRKVQIDVQLPQVGKDEVATIIPEGSCDFSNGEAMSVLRADPEFL